MANKKLNATIIIGGAISGALKSALSTTKSKINDVGGAIRKLEREQRKLGFTMRRDLGKAGTDLGAVHRRYAEVTREIEKQKRALDRLRTSQEAAAKRGELRGKIGGTLAAGAAVAVPAGSAFSKAMAFDYQMQLIGNTAEMTRAQIVALGADVLETSKKTGHSAEEMQQAMGFLIAAGMEVDIARDSLITIGKAATASGAEIEDLSKAAFTLNDSLKIQPGEGLRLALDTLAQTGKEGNVELRDMAKVLPVLGSGMAALKMEGREAAATIGAALQIGRKGTDSADKAATNMENFIGKIMSPVTKKKALENFGIDISKVIKDAQKNGANPFDAAMQAVIGATGGDQEKIGELFQDMEVQKFIRPMMQNWDKYLEIKNKALGVDGVLDRDFEEVMRTTKKQLDGVTQEFGRLGIALGRTLQPALASFAAVMVPVLQSVTAFIQEHPNLVAGVVMVAMGFTTLRLAVLGARFAFTFILPVLTQAWNVIKMLGTALLWAGRILLFVGRALLLNPIGLAVTAIAGAVYLIYKNWEPIKAFFINLWDSVTKAFTKAMDWIVEKIAYVGGKWREFKAMVGFGGEDEKAQPGTPSAPQTNMPRILTATRGGVTDNSNTQIIIHGAPGQSPTQISEEVLRLIERRKGVKLRSDLYDRVPQGAT